ncbi:MAG TPA: rubrerythrin [Chromatiales bacterium]|nr:rubrerythrin [Chromatiales bacterium]
MKTENASQTIRNLESAFAGECMAHVKYLWFARVCRAHGDEESARVFEETAAQEMQHAFGHLDLLLPADRLDPARCLELAIEGETHEYTDMYPRFRHMAEAEGEEAAAREFDEQIAESKEHAERFRATLEKAAKRFAALTRVEERHARRYEEALSRVAGA